MKIQYLSTLFISALLFISSLRVSVAEIKNGDLKETFRQHVSILSDDSLEGRGVGTEGLVKARKYIIDHFEQAGLQKFNDSYEQSFKFRQSVIWTKAINLVGYIEGNDPDYKDEYIVIGAHYDHLGYSLDETGQRVYYPGADDNASGTAMMMELAKYFSQNKENLKRSLIFIAFDAEESGLNGAEHFVKNNPVGIENIKLMFSLDMVGMYNTNNGMDLKGIGMLTEGADIARQIASTQSFRIKSTSDNVVRNTDTAPFGRKGIPSAHAFTGLKSPYHKPEDTYDLIEYDGMVKVYNYLSSLINILAQKENLEPAVSVTVIEKSNALYAGVRFAAGRGFHRYQDEFYRADPVLNLQAGFYFQVPLGRIFTLQQDVLMDINRSNAPTDVVRRYSVTLPLSIQLGTPRDLAPSFRAFASLGGYYRYNFSGDTDGVASDAEFHQNEWGGNTGFGIEIADFLIMYQYYLGFSDVFKGETPKVRDVNHMLSVGYSF